MVTRCHSLSFVVTRCTTRCHSLSFVVTRCTTRCHSLSLVVPLVVTRCHSLSLVVPLVVTRCTTRLSFDKRSSFYLKCYQANSDKSASAFSFIRKCRSFKRSTRQDNTLKQINFEATYGFQDIEQFQDIATVSVHILNIQFRISN